MCVHNAGRSQMAAALVHALSDGKVHVRSAGSEPANHINVAVVAAMGELGLDLPPRSFQAVDRRSGRCGRCRHHDGLRRRLPCLSRQALRRLGSRRSCRSAARQGPDDSKRHSSARRAICSASSASLSATGSANPVRPSSSATCRSRLQFVDRHAQKQFETPAAGLRPGFTSRRRAYTRSQMRLRHALAVSPPDESRF